ncbi:hypothetical protein A2U01_0049304, partial [Trifolium medium]|nr:hypothetical protein [Trifolium medium]
KVINVRTSSPSLEPDQMPISQAMPLLRKASVNCLGTKQ